MPRTMIGQQTRALRASKCYEDFYAGRALVHGRTHVNTPGMTHQGTVLCMHYWRIVGKADGMLKDDGMLKEGNVRERETFKGRESSTTRRCSRAWDPSPGLALPFCLPGLRAPHTMMFS